MSSNPTVSILVCAYNATHYGKGYLEQLCESIQAQTFKDFEVLFGDNGSTDETAELVKPYLADSRFHLIRWAPNRGLQHGTMILLNEARGRFWYLPGIDDVMTPRLLEQRVARLTQRPDVALVHGAVEWIDEHSKPNTSDFAQRVMPELNRRLPETVSSERMIRILLQHNIINWHSTLIRMDVTRMVLPFFSRRWEIPLDWILWILIAATGFDFLWDPEPLVKYRVHSRSLSTLPEKEIARKTERKLGLLYALRAASVYSPLARAVWHEHRLALYRWWLATAFALQKKGALKQADLLFATDMYQGYPRRTVNLWTELLAHGLPAVCQYKREKAANERQLFQVSGFSLIDDPLFRIS